MGRGQKTGARLKSAETAKLAAQRHVEGKPWREIADELGFSDESGVRQLVNRWIEKLPRENVETYRVILLERLNAAHRAAAELLTDDDKDRRLNAARTVARIAERIGRVTGVERPETIALLLKPPPAPPTDGPDLSRLSPAELGVASALQSILAGNRPPSADLVAAAQAWLCEVATPLPVLPPAPVVEVVDEDDVLVGVFDGA